MVDVPNAFIQTDNEGEVVIMNLRGQLAECVAQHLKYIKNL